MSIGQAWRGAAALKSAPNLVFLGLCALILASSLVHYPTILAFFEMLLVLLYLLVLRRGPKAAYPNEVNPVILGLFGLWFVSVTLSFLTSPYDVASTMTGVLRYQQTMFHVIFFLVLRELFSRYRLPLEWIFIAIAGACCIVGIAMAIALMKLDSYDGQTAALWFNNPPFHGHIRHTGYQVAAGISALLVFFVARSGTPVSLWTLSVMLLGLCTFLIWMGGRGSLLSVLVASGLLSMTLRTMGQPSHRLWLALGLSMVLGTVMAQWLVVFPWNGLFDLVERTASAVAEGADEVASGRIALWLSAWTSVKGHLWFGLGPQAYVFMPNHIFGIQPHSMVMQFLVEWGLLGGLLFSALLAYGFYRGFMLHIVRAGRDQVDLAALAAGTVIVALTFHGLFDGTYYHPQPSLYLATAFAVWTSPKRAADGVGE